jgi:hypothetical protein
MVTMDVKNVCAIRQVMPRQLQHITLLMQMQGHQILVMILLLADITAN